METPGFVSAWPQIAFLHLCPHPIQNLKKRRRSAYEWWAGLRRFFIRPVGRNETRCIWRIVFRVENLYNSGYNKINPNRRLEDERSG